MCLLAVFGCLQLLFAYCSDDGTCGDVQPLQFPFEASAEDPRVFVLNNTYYMYYYANGEGTAAVAVAGERHRPGSRQWYANDAVDLQRPRSPAARRHVVCRRGSEHCVPPPHGHTAERQQLGGGCVSAAVAQVSPAARWCCSLTSCLIAEHGSTAPQALPPPLAPLYHPSTSPTPSGPRRNGCVITRADGTHYVIFGESPPLPGLGIATTSNFTTYDVVNATFMEPNGAGNSAEPEIVIEAASTPVQLSTGDYFHLYAAGTPGWVRARMRGGLGASRAPVRSHPRHQQYPCWCLGYAGRQRQLHWRVGCAGPDRPYAHPAAVDDAPFCSHHGACNAATCMRAPARVGVGRPDATRAWPT